MPVQTIDVTVTSDRDVVPCVRHVARQVGVVFGCRVDVEVLALLTTELVSNAVQQAGGVVVVSFSRPTTDRVRVGVWDAAPGRPRLTVPAPLDGGGRRGLFVVDQLSTSWGVDRRPVGKAVWCEVPCRPRAPDPPRRPRADGGPIHGEPHHDVHAPTT